MSLFDSLYEEKSGTGTDTSEAPDPPDGDSDGTAGDSDGTAGDTAGDASGTAGDGDADGGMDAAATPTELDAPDEPVGIDDLEELAREAAAGGGSSSEHLDEGTEASTDQSLEAGVDEDTHDTVEGTSDEIGDESSGVAADSAQTVEELDAPAPTGGSVFDFGADQAGGGEEASEDHDEAFASPEPLASPEPAAGGEPPISEVGPRRPSQTEVSEAAGDFAALISPPTDGAPGVTGGDRSDGPAATEPSTAPADDDDPSGAVDFDADREADLPDTDSAEDSAFEAPHEITGPRLGVDLLPSGRTLALPVPKPRPELFKKLAVLVLLAVVGFMVHRVVLADDSGGTVEQPAREAPSAQGASPGGDTGASPGGDADADGTGDAVDAAQLAEVETELRDAAVAAQAYHAETGDFAADAQLLDELVAGTEVVAAGEAPAQGTLSVVTGPGAACFETVVAGDTVAAAGVTAEGVRFSSGTDGASLCTTDAAAIASWASSLSLP